MNPQLGPGTVNSIEMTATVVIRVVVGDVDVAMEWVAAEEATE